VGNTTLTVGGDYQRFYAYSYIAEWRFRGAVASTDPNAVEFGPRPWNQRQGVLRAAEARDAYDPTRGRYAKPVVYLPVKRRDGQDQLPTLIVSIKLVSPQLTGNNQVKIWAGTSVEVEVVNVLTLPPPGSSEPKVTLQGKLDANLSCEIEVKASDVTSWLKDGSALKALVNENLLDFRFKLNGVSDGGKPVVGQSRNRLFLYCRKTIVFLPGLFGSQLHVTLADGTALGYPMFWKSGHFDWALLNKDQTAGVLECDENGLPLLSFPNLSLLMLHSFHYLPHVLPFVPQDVIDPFGACHEARMTILPHVPPEFQLFTLTIYPYDWRTDLTDAAARLNQHLLDLKTKRLTPAPDTDDQVAVIGHSTGGVVIRRALGPIADADCLDPGIKNGNHPEADSLISLAFFLSVPFSGAPKALPVLMTGLQEPEGKRMIPMLVPETLFAISLVMPIVYHLATTEDYAYRPASSPSRNFKATDYKKDHEADKASFVTDALDAGLMPRPWFVKASVADPDLRRRLAIGADDWHKLVRELAERTNGLSLIQATNNSWTATNWFTTEIQRRGLQYQYDARRMGGWNATLAGRARDFHQKSLSAIAGVWKQRSAIFFGIAEEPTFRQINLSKSNDIKHSGGVLGVLHDRRVIVQDIASVSQPTYQHVDWHSDDKTVQFMGGIETFSQWSVKGDQVTETPWTLEWVKQAFAGDGTVPSDSQLAEATNVAKLIPIADYEKSPKHMDTTKVAHVWESLVVAMHRGFAALKDASGINSASNQKSAALEQLKQAPKKDVLFVRETS
jgi:hypothetical protein